MRWSWRLGRIAGIGVYVHATFPLLLAWVALSQLSSGATVAGVIYALMLILVVFGIVVAHELGHALMARRFGIGTRDITLLPIGGVARLERMPREPMQELAIALAGPAVNLVLAFVCYVLLQFAGDDGGTLAELTNVEMRVDLRSGLVQLLTVNLWLLMFNLLPAFPLDGGRALRALIAWKSGDFAKATIMAAQVGRVFALLFGLLGLFVVRNPFLVVIALFVWLAAAGEAQSVQTSVALDGVPLERLLITELRTLTPQEPLARASQLVIDGFQQDFPVLEDGRLVGMVGRADLVRGLTAHGGEGRVDTVMRRDFPRASVDESAEVALERLAAGKGNALPVLRGPWLAGLLTAENVMEFLMFRTAVEGKGGRG
jgi:Zn-dependent protease